MTNEHYQKIPFLPINDESTHLELEIDGNIPFELDGLYVRNGPNYMSEIKPNHHHFSGHGMLHGVRLKEGKALWYRNRIVRGGNIAQVLSEKDIGGPIANGIDASPNTNVVIFGGSMYASISGANLVKVDHFLGSIKRSDLNGILDYGFTGHHKVDPVNHEIHGVVYGNTLGDQAQYLRIKPDGTLINKVKVPLAGATQIHDMSITENYAVIYDLNVVFDPSILDKTNYPVRWNRNKPARVGILPKNGKASHIRWFEVEPCYVYHPMNAYETIDNKIVIDVCRYTQAAKKDLHGPLGDTQPTIDRWVCDLNGNTNQTKESRITDEPIDFPKVSPLVEGRRYRYGYAIVAKPVPSFEGAVKIDHQTGRLQHQHFDGGNASELTFIPRKGAREEDDGWLIGFCFDPKKVRSRLLILNGKDFDGEPEASIWIPDSYVPIGAHGSWFPGFGGI